MALINGTDLILKVGTSDSTEVIVAHATNCSLELSMDERDITSKDSAGWKEIAGGLRNWSISTDALYDATDLGATKTDFVALFDLVDARTKIYVEFTILSPATGDYIYTGEGYVTSLSLSGGVEDTATYSCSITGTGDLDKAVTS
jgi:TP901-1 family phage major tail protein